MGKLKNRNFHSTLPNLYLLFIDFFIYFIQFFRFQKESNHKYSKNEIIMSWEVLRLRLLEYLYQNQLGIGLNKKLIENLTIFFSLTLNR